MPGPARAPCREKEVRQDLPILGQQAAQVDQQRRDLVGVHVGKDAAQVDEIERAVPQGDMRHLISAESEAGPAKSPPTEGDRLLGQVGAMITPFRSEILFKWISKLTRATADVQDPGTRGKPLVDQQLELELAQSLELLPAGGADDGPVIALQVRPAVGAAVIEVTKKAAPQGGQQALDQPDQGLHDRPPGAVTRSKARS
jgi:hypothetical protein